MNATPKPLPALAALLLLALALAACGGDDPAPEATPAATATPTTAPTATATPTPSAVGDALALDPAVTRGELGNGLTYYVRRNGEPRGRAFLSLVVKAGSVLEEERQRGLAHFVEHMAFNGTERFARSRRSSSTSNPSAAPSGPTSTPRPARTRPSTSWRCRRTTPRSSRRRSAS